MILCNPKKSRTQRWSLAFVRIGLFMLSLPTGCAAVAAAAAPAADSAAGGNGTSCNPIPEHSFVVFVATMLSTFQQIMNARWSLAHHNIL